jgi:predicted ester cyclase
VEHAPRHEAVPLEVDGVDTGTARDEVQVMKQRPLRESKIDRLVAHDELAQLHDLGERGALIEMDLGDVASRFDHASARFDLVAAGPKAHSDHMTTTDHKQLVRGFYSDCLTVNRHADPAAVMARLLADDFQSINASGAKDKATMIKQVQGFWQLIPDLAWLPEEVFEDGEAVIVRSTATGTPKGPFMGMTLDGTRSFKIMSIDIHRVVDGRIARVHHLEEWTTAIQQLKA